MYWSLSLGYNRDGDDVMKKELNIQIGERIRRRREFLKMTREELAELVGVSALFMSYIETGRKGMSLATLKKLCEVLCLSADEVLLGHQQELGEELMDLLEQLDPRFQPMAEEMIRALVKAIASARHSTEREMETLS